MAFFSVQIVLLNSASRLYLTQDCGWTARLLDREALQRLCRGAEASVPPNQNSAIRPPLEGRSMFGSASWTPWAGCRNGSQQRTHDVLITDGLR
jgi:hypothetical protein